MTNPPLWMGAVRKPRWFIKVKVGLRKKCMMNNWNLNRKYNK